MAKKFLDSIGGGGYNRILFNLPHDQVRGETMDFIERIFGLAPDGGSGSLEFLLFLEAVLKPLTPVVSVIGES
jgi:hypothetical protein